VGAESWGEAVSDAKYDPDLRIYAEPDGDLAVRVALIVTSTRDDGVRERQHNSLSPDAARHLAKQLTDAADKAQGRT
jgi:hypothetical protein